MQDEKMELQVPKDFVHRTLPWLVIGAALLVYGLSLTPWPTLYGLPIMARLSGWDWQPVIYGPVHFLVTYPIRWLPPGWQLLAWKLFSVVCAALTLGLLARSVSLLPHDRTPDQRLLEGSEYSLLSLPTAWMPVVFAVLVCGLQLSFWEHAVEASIEGLDLLLFAYVIRCLLEHRIDQRESWLYKSAFVYGLGMSSNVAMVGFLPAWLIALVWVRGRAFFNPRFLARMAGLGLAGLLFYLLLPALASASGEAEQSFGQMLRAVLGYQRGVLFGVPRYLVLLMSLTSVAPVAFMGIRWPTHSGDISVAGTYLARFTTHLIHAIFLVACLYVSFDPVLSPRRLGGGMFVYLPFYYLGALAVGYCSGYFLLVFGKPSDPKIWQRLAPWRRAVNGVLVTAVWVAFVAVPVGLAVQNYPQLRATALREMNLFAQAAARQLPDRAVVLSDETPVLYGLRVALNQVGRKADLILLDTVALVEPGYHRWLRRHHAQWPSTPDPGPGVRMDPRLLVQLVSQLAQSRPLFYLQPSFGYYMEDFYLKPAGPLYQMVRIPAGTVSPPPTPVAELEASARFWRQFKAQHLTHMIQTVKSATAAKAKPKASPQTQLTAATFYSAAVFSRGLNFLGVEYQKAGALDQAAEFFAAALELNPDNPMAYLNQEFNAVLRGKAQPQPGPSEAVRKRLEPYRGNWDNILKLNGPADEPNTYFHLSRAFSNNGLYRQAARCLERTLALVPADPTVRLALANAYSGAGLPDRALELVAQLRSQLDPKRTPESVEVALAQADALAYGAQKDLAKAEQVLRAIQEKYPQNPAGFSTLAELYLKEGRYKDAIPVLERQIRVQTTNINAMVNLAALYMREGLTEKAVALLDRTLSLQPDNVPARMNRAIAYMGLKQWDQAQRDYEALQLTVRNPDPRIHYGLGEVYAAKGMRQRAVEHYRKYLKIAPPNTPEAKYVRDRLKALQ
jgi:tetratricopeptide (TPR) repeat protein